MSLSRTSVKPYCKFCLVDVFKDSNDEEIIGNKRMLKRGLDYLHKKFNRSQRAHILEGFKRDKVKGDGNYAFRSYSQAIAAHQNLHIPFRQGTTAMMRSNPTRYNRMMTTSVYNRYIIDKVAKVGMSIGKDAAQVAADLLRVRMIHTYATSSQIIREITPHDGPIFYEINLGNIPGHVDTLGRNHLYAYHLED